MQVRTWLNTFLARGLAPRLPMRSADIPPYAAAFEAAATFTGRLGFPVPFPMVNTAKDLSVDGPLLTASLGAAGIYELEPSATQCLKWCHYLAPHFEATLGQPVALTIGQLWKGDTRVFGPDFVQLRRWVNKGMGLDDFAAGGGLNLHAWLTLPSGEIIDPTIMNTLAKHGHPSYKKFAGSAVWGVDPNVLPEHRYFPMLIGADACEAIAVRSGMPLLARDKEDLFRISWAAMI